MKNSELYRTEHGICIDPGTGFVGIEVGYPTVAQVQELNDHEFTAVIFRERSRGNRFVLQYRFKKNFLNRGKIDSGKPFQGRIGMFGGGVNKSDSSAEACAVRELSEELDASFQINDLIKIGTIYTFDDNAKWGLGHIFAVESLEPHSVKALRTNYEGKLVKLTAAQVGQRWRKLTPITGFAILQYFEFVRLRNQQA